MRPTTPKLAPHLERPRRETTREVMLRSVNTAAGVRLWWAAAITAGTGPTLLDTLLELSKAPTWGAVFGPSILYSLGLILVSAAGVVLGIMAPPFADGRKALQAMLRRAK